MDWKYPFSGEEYMKAIQRTVDKIMVNYYYAGQEEIFLKGKVKSIPAHIYDLTNHFLWDNFIPVGPYSNLKLRETDIDKTSKSYLFQIEQLVSTDLGVFGYVNAYPINNHFTEVVIGARGGLIPYDFEEKEPQKMYEGFRQFLISLADYFEGIFLSKVESKVLFKLSKNYEVPNERTQMRYEIFRKLKEQHPTWSQARVAGEASKDLDEQVSADTVRNAYRSMGVKWERGDRIR